MADFSPAIRKLEFEKILDRLRQLVVSDPAREQIAALTPFTDSSTIQLELDRVSEAKELVIAEGGVPLDGMKDIRTALKKAGIEHHFLNPTELLDIASTLRVARTVSAFVAKRKSVYVQLPALLETLFYDRVVEFNIMQCVDEEGSVKDSASKDLHRIRKDIISTSDVLRKRLEVILKRVSEKELTQEEIITTRDGRLVIPIKVEHKNHVPGFIHSSSASGATVFIEPAETLDLNNTLRELQLAEQREIVRILTELTQQVRNIREELERGFLTLCLLDAIVAKAKYSIEVLGSSPKLSTEGRIKLLQARHPVLLQRHRRDEVIPLDLELGGDLRTLIITGPNAGGKSVAMKTVGLLVLCAQAGLHIPASPESEICIFDNIYVDMGDDQSIENDLSTFSSHLLRLKQILEETGRRTLVLIDEIGAGTDPAEGGALAAAILTNLTHRGALTIATTHHGMLKAFAHESQGISNASMEFDQDSLRPTYRFRMGVPGSSYALELAKRLGLPSDVINRARELVGDEKIKLEQLLIDLEKQSQFYQEQIRTVSTERDRLDILVKSYDQKIKDLHKELQSIRKKAADEAQEIVRNAQALIERSVKEIKESAAEKTIVKTARENIRRLNEELTSQSPVETQVELVDFALGDLVRLKSGSEVGEIVETKGTDAIVLWGSAKLRVKLKDLRKETKVKTPSYANVSSSYSVEGTTEIDLRGMMGEEAIPKVQYFLDNAVMVGLHRVDIIHGKGTGALRKRVTEFLKTYPHVKSFRLGEWNEGGTGVTVVELAD